jgi:hypothetical protein
MSGNVENRWPYDRGMDIMPRLPRSVSYANVTLQYPYHATYKNENLHQDRMMLVPVSNVLSWLLT